MTYDQAVKIAIGAMSKQRQGIAVDANISRLIKVGAPESCIKAELLHDQLSEAIEILKVGTTNA